MTMKKSGESKNVHGWKSKITRIRFATTSSEARNAWKNTVAGKSLAGNSEIGIHKLICLGLAYEKSRQHCSKK